MSAIKKFFSDLFARIAASLNALTHTKSKEVEVKRKSRRKKERKKTVEKKSSSLWPTKAFPGFGNTGAGGDSSRKTPTKRSLALPGRVKSKINQLLDTSVRATRRMLSICSEIEELGVNILVALDVQLEQADNIELMTEEINQLINQAENHIENLEKCCGLCVLPWDRRVDTSQLVEVPEDEDDDISVIDVSTFVSAHNAQDPGEQPFGPFFENVVNDPRESEIERNLAKMGRMLSVIRRMVIDIGAELELQHKTLPYICKKTAALEKKVKGDTVRLAKILDKEGVDSGTSNPAGPAAAASAIT